MLIFSSLIGNIFEFDGIQQAIRYIQTIGFSDLLDVAIIAFIIYRLILLMRNSQAGQVIKGVLLVIVLLGLSDLFNLHVLNFLLNSVVQIGILALIIVFQPEIRRFLGQVGSSRFRRTFLLEGERDVLETAITETVSAYQEEELMKNIFYPKAPLHDGAVIVRDGRIVGAGCVLPLSGNSNISRDLGTRHRAGLGITEHTDAVAVICSEETGSISVAMEGMLKRHLAPETLERLLRNELLTEQEEKKSVFSAPTLDNLMSLFRGKKEGEDHVGKN